MRRLALLDPDEEARYLALGARLVGRIERSMHPAAVANRACPRRGAQGRLRLESLGPARARWRRELGRLLASGPATVVVADVRDCYGSIGGEVVQEALLGVGCSREDVDGVGRLLARWDAAGSPGLPVGPLASAVLANAVLASVDRELASGGWRHVRWVDDLVVTARQPSAEGEILERLRACLVRLGLRLAEEKCRAAAPGDPSLTEVTAASGGRPAGRRASPGPHGDAVERDLRRVGEPGAPLDTLHALRRLAARRLGPAEVKVIQSVAGDEETHDVVRAWAWRALARTDPSAVLERAAALGDEPSPYLRRSVAVAVALIDGRAARAFLRHHRRSSDGLATAEWGLAR